MEDPHPFKPDFALKLVRRDDRSAVIEVGGELDSGSCEQLLATVQSAVAAASSKLMLDLTRMTFIDSAGVRALIMIERLAAAQSIALTVTPPPDQVTELLRTAGLVDRTGAEAASPTGRFVERTELELPRQPHSPARARGEVRACLSAHGQADERSSVVLLTSELVTNAVVHPRGVGDAPIGLRVVLFADRVRIEVEDTGEGFVHAKPTLPEGERGRGLYLVDRFSDRWGSERVQTGAGPRFRVWFELGWREHGTEAVA